MWILLAIFLFNLSTNQVLADDPVVTPSVATQTATPTLIPSPTIIPTPTPDPIKVLFEKYKTDYLYQKDLYQAAYLKYVDKKTVHTKYGTLITKKESIDATKEALAARNNMLQAYLLALRVDLDKYKVNNPIETERNQIDIKKWEDWCQEQKLIIDNLNNEEDIKKYAGTFNNKYISIQQIIYTALVQNQSNLYRQTLTKINNLALLVKNSPKISPESLSWFDNLPVKSDLVLNNLKNAIDITQKKQADSYKFNNFYPSARNELNKAGSYLSEMSSNLKSIVLKFSN